MTQTKKRHKIFRINSLDSCIMKKHLIGKKRRINDHGMNKMNMGGTKHVRKRIMGNYLGCKYLIETKLENLQNLR